MVFGIFQEHENMKTVTIYIFIKDKHYLHHRTQMLDFYSDNWARFFRGYG